MTVKAFFQKNYGVDYIYKWFILEENIVQLESTIRMFVPFVKLLEEKHFLIKNAFLSSGYAIWNHLDCKVEAEGNIAVTESTWLISTGCLVIQKFKNWLGPWFKCETKHFEIQVTLNQAMGCENDAQKKAHENAQTWPSITQR